MLKKLIYMDNSATTHKKPISVVFNVFKATTLYSGNGGRSGHKLSLKILKTIFETRQLIAKYYNIDEIEKVIFTKNCTEALNIVIQGIDLTNKDVICSCFEHNSVLRPLHSLKEKGKISNLIIVKPHNNNFITAEDIERKITYNTKLVCVTHISNVTGNRNEIEKIGNLCYSKGILFLVDDAQGCGHFRLNMQKNHINYLCFAGHKGFFAPQSIGGLCINSEIIPTALISGGTGTNSQQLIQPMELPEYLESGTLATPQIYGLNAGLKYVLKNENKISAKTKGLIEYLYTKLMEIDEIIVYTNKDFYSGVISFNIKGIDSTTVSNYLDSQYNIATRSGLHCAPLTHEFFDTTKIGMIRVSLNNFNSKREINIFLKAINNFIKSLKSEEYINSICK